MDDPAMPWEAQLNHHADKLAGQAHNEPTNPGLLPQGCKIVFYIQETPIMTKNQQEIH